MAVCLFLGLYTGQRLYYLAACALALAMALSAALAFWGMTALRYQQSIAQGMVQKGDAVTMLFDLQNGMPLPLPYLRLTYHTLPSSIAGTPLTQTLWLPGLGSRQLSVPFPAQYWGRYHIGLIQAEVGDPLGLFRFTLRLDKLSYHKPLRVLVYPRTLMPARMNLPARLTQGQDDRRGQPVEHSAQLDQIRAYRRGDALRRVHWKLTARNRALMVKVYEDSSRPRLLLAVDCRAHGYDGVDAIRVEDTVVESAAAISNYALHHGLPLRLLAYPAEGALRLEGDDASHFAAFHQSIAALTFDGEFALEQILPVEPFDREMGVIVLTARLTSALFDQLVTQRMKGVRVLALCVAAPDNDDECQRAAEKLRERGVRAAVLPAGGDVCKAVSEL